MVSNDTVIYKRDLLELTFECEKHESGDDVLFLFRFRDVAPKAEIVVIPNRVVIVGHNVGIGKGDIPTTDDQPGFVTLISELRR